MPDQPNQELELYGIKEVSEKTGLPPTTIRYYDQQFCEYLAVKRGAGRRRLFPPESLGKLINLKRLLKDEGLSLRQARQVLAVGEAPGEAAPLGPSGNEIEVLRREVQDLGRQMEELKEIQRRTLVLVDGLTPS